MCCRDESLLTLVTSLNLKKPMEARETSLKASEGRNSTLEKFGGDTLVCDLHYDM